MKKLFIGLFVLLGLFSLAACQEKAPAGLEDFEQNENEFVPDIHMYIIGSCFNNWDPATIVEADPSCTFVKDENSAGLDTKYVYTVEITQEMIGDWCGFKFIAQNSWAGAQFGMEDVDFEKSSQTFKDMIGKDKEEFTGGPTNRSNIEINQPGTYVIEYYPYNFTSVETAATTYTCKFVINFTPAAAATE